MRKVVLRMNKQFKYDIIKKLVDDNGNKKRAAQKLNCSVRTINRLIAFWDSLFPDWRDFEQNDLKIESLKRHKILFGSTHGYRSLVYYQQSCNSDSNFF